MEIHRNWKSCTESA